MIGNSGINWGPVLHAEEHSVTVIIINFDVEEKRNSDDKGKDPYAVHNYLGNFQGYIKTESSRKLSNFNSQSTLYQNNLKNIAFFFTSVFCNNTKKNLSWQSEKMNVKLHKNCEKTEKILKTSCVRCNFLKFDIHFLGVP